MSLSTPKQRGGVGLRQPSFGNTNTASSPSLRATTTEVNRKASLRALTGGGGQGTPGSTGKMGEDLEVGDTVTVPGDMYGVVKFVGNVRGKNGSFVGVELDRQFAAKGKNDGDVDGTQYFTTSLPGAGIFLPTHRAEKRLSPAPSTDSYPATPNTPSHSTINGRRTKDGRTPTTPALPHKFSQSVGPGARPQSPTFKGRRPSLPRPESPFRKQPTLAPTPSARNLSQSVRGGRPNLGPTPSKSSLKSSTSGRPPASTPSRPYSRTGSRIGNRGDTIDEDRTPSGTGRSASNASVPSYSHTMRSPSRLGSAGGQDAEIQRLKTELAERDRRLEEQAANLAEMDSSVRELSALIPTDGTSPGGRGFDDDDKSASQLRQALREKNEKISMLTSEFDAHRADFRSTLDSLEMASTETERVYEEQKRDLLAQIEELQDSAQQHEDFESVAKQLKQLEELVAELEEGLEESRRGEAEARGEVEFLRGEVERGRSELRREREKAADALQLASGSGGSSREIEQRDDEIRGLKALIHSLSDGRASSQSPNGIGSGGADPEEVQRLQAALDESRVEREDLERELEQLRRDTAVGKTNGNAHTRNESDMTEKGLPTRPRGDTVKATFADRSRQQALEEDINGENEDVDQDGDRDGGTDGGTDGVFCELCKSAEHDTLDCTQLKADRSDSQQQHEHEQGPANMPKPLSLGKEKEEMSPSKPEPKDDDKWCALCEKDGHLAFDCPEEQY